MLVEIIFSKIVELEEELKIVGNNMRSLEIAEQEVVFNFKKWTSSFLHLFYTIDIESHIHVKIARKLDFKGHHKFIFKGRQTIVLQQKFKQSSMRIKAFLTLAMKWFGRFHSVPEQLQISLREWTFLDADVCARI